MSPLRGPVSLQKLLDSYDANTRRCLGCSFPAHERCENKIDSKIDDLQLAFADLRDLLSQGWDDHGPGLIDKLRSIAHTFSCSKHQQTSGHTSQFTYYWLASNILPNIVECMGYGLGLSEISARVDLEPRCKAPMCTMDHYCASRVQALLDGLAISKVWLLCEALNFLTGQWLENIHYKSGPERIRKILDARLASSNSNQDEVAILREAEQQWKMWHLTLSRKYTEADQARSTDGDCEGPNSSTIRNTQTRKVESNMSSKIAGAITSEKANLSTVIEESPKRNNLDEELARGPSNVRSVSSSQPVTSKPSPLIPEHNIHGSAPSVLQQPKNRQNRIRRGASAPQTLEPLDNGLSAKNTDIGKPSGPPQHVETGTADDPSGVSSSTFPMLSKDHRALVKRKEIIDVDETTITRPLFPNFQPWEGQRPQLTTAIVREVFDVMKKPLSETKQLDEGRIYTLRMISRPGYVKIGRTIQSISQRKRQISACLPYEMEIINDGDSCMVPNHRRIEALVHTELQSYRRYFKCPCIQKTRGNLHDCEENDGMTQHGEWFEIDEKHACEVVGLWRRWMSTNPYSNGKLRSFQQAKVALYANNQSLMEAMVIKDENGRERWDWTGYLDSPQWALRMSWIHKFLFGERFVKSRRSRWDSLKEHWLPNFVFFCVTSLMFPCVLFVVSYFLPPIFSNALVFAITSCAVVSAAAILYTA